MVVNDPIGDMLTRIRNAQSVRKSVVDIPLAKIKVHIGQILKAEGYVEEVGVITDAEGHKQLRLTLKYHQNKPVIEEIKRCSTPGRRKYVGKDEIPRVYQGLGIAILSTNRGVLSSREARRLGVGGELLCTVF